VFGGGDTKLDPLRDAGSPSPTTEVCQRLD
jgi:hypothetical protein